MSAQPVASYERVMEYLTQHNIKPTGNKYADYQIARATQAKEEGAKNPEVQALMSSGGSGKVKNAVGDADLTVENGRITNVTYGGWVKPLLAAGAVAGGGLGLAALAGGGAAAGASALGPVAAGGGTTAATVPASLAATGGTGALTGGGVTGWLAKNGLDLGLGALSLLGGPDDLKPFKGDLSPEHLLGDSVAQTKALQAQLQAHQPLKLREPAGSTAGVAPVSIPGLGLQIGGALHRDYLPSSDPMQASDQTGTGMNPLEGLLNQSTTPANSAVRRRTPPNG